MICENDLRRSLIVIMVFTFNSITSFCCILFLVFIVVPHIPANAKWSQRGVTVAGGHENGDDFNQLSYPVGLCVDENRTVTIADSKNGRVVQ